MQRDTTLLWGLRDSRWAGFLHFHGFDHIGGGFGTADTGLGNGRSPRLAWEIQGDLLQACQDIDHPQIQRPRGCPVSGDQRTEQRIRELQRGHRRETNTRWLFERYFPALRKIFARWGCPDDECSDLSQETFVKAYRRLASFQHDASFDTWLFRIARNEWKNDLRSKGAQKRDVEIVSLASDEVDDERLRDPAEPDPEAKYLADERTRLRRRALRRALRQLPPQMRRCAVLRLEQGLKYREIASVLGISMNRVRSLLYGARRRLREEVVKHYPEIEL